MTERPIRIAIVIGEDSGDQLGAGLVDAIRRVRPDALFAGLAGDRMGSRGLVSFFPIGDVAVMGLGAIVSHLPRIVRRGYQTVTAVLKFCPDILVIIDSPGFTHAVAKRVAKAQPEIPIVDYVSPSVWAWRPGRAQRMCGYVDHILALLPFEPAVHESLGGPPCTYVGHPLVEKLSELQPSPGERGPLDADATLLVLPGSRHTEVSRLMEPFGEAVRRIADTRPAIRVVLPAVSHLRAEIEQRAALWQVRPEIVHGESAKFAAFRQAHAALAASGTVTLELGLAGVPMVVAYRVDPVARLLKRFLKAPSIVLTNLVLGENVVPEFLDERATPEILARETLALLSNSQKRSGQEAALAMLPHLLQVPIPPSDAAAAIVLNTAERGAGKRAAKLQRRPEIGT